MGVVIGGQDDAARLPSLAWLQHVHPKSSPIGGQRVDPALVCSWRPGTCSGRLAAAQRPTGWASSPHTLSRHVSTPAAVTHGTASQPVCKARRLLCPRHSHHAAHVLVSHR
jgi:hypothetical protein